MALNVQLVLRGRQRLAGRDTQLPLHQIMTRDHLGDRMFDLQAGIHFHEVKPTIRFHDEFHCACAAVAAARAAATAAQAQWNSSWNRMVGFTSWK